MITSNDCKLALIEYVKQHEVYLSNQFDPPMSMLPAMQKTNWKRREKVTANNLVERFFDCEPYDDMLRGYTTDDKITILAVEVCDE